MTCAPWERQIPWSSAAAVCSNARHWSGSYKSTVIASPILTNAFERHSRSSGYLVGHPIPGSKSLSRPARQDSDSQNRLEGRRFRQASDQSADLIKTTTTGVYIGPVWWNRDYRLSPQQPPRLPKLSAHIR